MTKSKLIIFIITISAIVIAAVINFVTIPGHWHLNEIRRHTIPFTEDFSVQGSWIISLIVAMGVLFFFFKFFNTMRARKGLNKRPNRY